MILKREFEISEDKLEKMILELQKQYQNTSNKTNKLLYKGGAIFIDSLLSNLIIEESIKKQKEYNKTKPIERLF
jgi:hypothetical protein